MSKDIQPVSLLIFGKEYKIACPVEEQQALIASAKQLDQQMRMIRDTGKVSSPDRIAVLAALNLSNDANYGSASSTENFAKISERIGNLRQKIEKVLENP
jgi:cell division protein ZapA